MPYELPEIIHPDTIKFCIEVPNERFYLEAFWGALWTLSRAYNHADDEDHTALEVASVWRDLWFVNHDGFIGGTNMCSGCCPQEYNLLLQIFNQNNFYMSYVMNMLDDGTPQSFMPDAPEGFTENTGDENVGARVRALCPAVVRYVYNVLNSVVNNYAAADQIGDILELLPPFGIIVGFVDAVTDIAQDAVAGLVGDTAAVNDVICQMLASLTGAENTQDNFRDSVNPSAFEPLSNSWQIAVIVDIANASIANWRAFNGILPELYEQMQSGAPADCPCCDPADFQIVAVNDCIVTNVDATHWRVQQTNFIVEGVDPHRIFEAVIKDEFDRCININSASGTAASSYRVTRCNGVVETGTGGSGGIVIENGEFKREQVTTPFVGIDVIYEILCPPDDE